LAVSKHVSDVTSRWTMPIPCFSFLPRAFFPLWGSATCPFWLCPLSPCPIFLALLLIEDWSPPGPAGPFLEGLLFGAASRKSRPPLRWLSPPWSLLAFFLFPLPSGLLSPFRIFACSPTTLPIAPYLSFKSLMFVPAVFSLSDYGDFFSAVCRLRMLIFNFLF